MTERSIEAQRPRRGLHVAIIMDGNGRWAQLRGLPRTEGHRRGADAVRTVVEEASKLGIETLTLYAFSSDNWKRPLVETAFLMDLFCTYLRKERARCIEEGVRVTVIGRRDRLPDPVIEEIDESERATARGEVLHLRLAIDYSSRDLIVHAARELSGEAATREDFSRVLGALSHDTLPASDVDLLIRTGGEQRLSDFLLWECAYAELLFTPCMWPDFEAVDLRAALDEFHGRERRFGTVTEPKTPRSHPTHGIPRVRLGQPTPDLPLGSPS